MVCECIFQNKLLFSGKSLLFDLNSSVVLSSCDISAHLPLIICDLYFSFCLSLSPSLSSLLICPCLYNICGCSGHSVSLFCTMKALPVLVLLSSAVQLCSTAPALEPLTCSEDIGAAAARLAMHHINEHHVHGYKFSLNEIQGNKLEKVWEPDLSSKHTHLLYY